MKLSSLAAWRSSVLIGIPAVVCVVMATEAERRSDAPGQRQLSSWRRAVLLLLLHILSWEEEEETWKHRFLLLSL